MASPFDARLTAAWTVRIGAERVPAALLSPDGATNQVLVSAPLEPGPDESDPWGWFRPSATSPPSATLAPSGMVTAAAAFAALPTTAFTRWDRSAGEGSAEPGPIDTAKARIAGGTSSLRRRGDARADDTSMKTRFPFCLGARRYRPPRTLIVDGCGAPRHGHRPRGVRLRRTAALRQPVLTECLHGPEGREPDED